MNPIQHGFSLIFVAACELACAQSPSTATAPAAAPPPAQATDAGTPPTIQSANQSAAPVNINSAARALMNLAKSNNKPLDKEQVGNWMESLGRLFEESPSAKNIVASGNTQAIALLEEARALRHEAKQVFDSGDIVKPQALLNKAAASFIQAARMSTPKPDPIKLKADLDDRIEKVTSLFEAYKRSVGEKPAAGVVATLRSIEAALANAGQQSAAGMFVEGRVAVDKALLLTRAASDSEAKYASPEDEYRHALERNDTHQMLIRLLLGEKRSEAEVDSSVKGNMEKASALRGQADAAAERKNYVDAIKMLGESTVELVQAIRKVGVSLPG